MPLPADVAVDAMMVNDSLSLCFFGEPPVQGRCRAWYNAMRRRVVMYDPSKTVKDAYKVLLGTALAEIGHRTGGPVFMRGRRVKVTARFYVQDNRKDVDNMLKFFLDVMQKKVYHDDRAVYMVVAIKEPNVPENNFRTEIDVEYLNYFVNE